VEPNMLSKRKKMSFGLALAELVVAMAISTIVILIVSVLIVGGQKAWNRTYSIAHKEIKLQAQDILLSFGNRGRKANRLDYVLYDVGAGGLTPVSPAGSNKEVVYGDAVEFRYWDVELDSSDSNGLLDVTKKATAYALFYLQGDILKVDHGQYPPGGVPDGGGARNTSGITTTILANNVSTVSGQGAFSHTTEGGSGKGCVRIHVTLTDPTDQEAITVATAAFMRNIWPR